MTIAVRYLTRSGNTEKLAKAIAEAVGVTAQDLSAPLEENADILFLGSSVYAADVDNAVKAFIKDNAHAIGRIVNFSTAALLRSTYTQVKKLAAANGVTMAPEEFHCRGAFTVMHRGRPNADDLQNAVAFAKGVIKQYQEDAQ